MTWTPAKVMEILLSPVADRSGRTAQLKEVLEAVREEQSLDGLAATVEKLADGARDRESKYVVHGWVREADGRVLWEQHLGGCPSEILEPWSSSSLVCPPGTANTP
jgi:hypothetical protein